MGDSRDDTCRLQDKDRESPYTRSLPIPGRFRCVPALLIANSISPVRSTPLRQRGAA
jgi:hypothetical protein